MMPRIFRKLLPQEYAAYEQHLLRLSPKDRRARFHSTMTDDGIAAHCARLQWPAVRLIGCFVDGALRGAVELQSTLPESGPAISELAVSVEEPYQGQGIGTELVRRTLVVARNRGLRNVLMMTQPDNGRMLDIGRRMIGQSSFDDGAILTEYRVGESDAVSFSEELADDGIALVLTGLARWQRSFAIWAPR